ncbi:MAG: hypothetical protein CMN30_16735 [Sandaracinus sp.]|nr:hypothetical protein [Sandaracinus sp.]|tara:strand:+ start:2968 stop:3558 length:591 start_codon:yes stop_codon:yes gene_type:complete
MGLLSNWVGRKIAPVDVDRTKARVHEAKGDGLDAAGVAERLTETHARRSALRGFLTGVPGGVWSLPLLLVDVRGVWSERASLAAGIHYANDPAFFEDPEWWRQVWAATAALSPESGTTGVMKFAAKEMFFRRLGKTAVKGLSTKLVPVVGGVAGAAWNYAWLKREGSRMRVDILTTEPDVQGDATARQKVSQPAPA